LHFRLYGKSQTGEPAPGDTDVTLRGLARTVIGSPP
jgi:hypothetical protein